MSTQPTNHTPVFVPEFTGNSGFVVVPVEKSTTPIVEPVPVVVQKRPFFTKQNKAFLLDVIFSPISVLAWLLALPVKAFTWAVVKMRTRRYDPEKEICPACGFKGDSGTNWKSCRIEFVRTAGSERAAIQHFCFKCGCDKHYSKLRMPAEKWMAKDPISNPTRRLG